MGVNESVSRLGQWCVTQEQRWQQNLQVRVIRKTLQLLFPLVLVGSLADFFNRSWLQPTGYYYQTLHVASWMLRRTRLQQVTVLLQTGALGLASLGAAFLVSYGVVAHVTTQARDRFLAGGLALLGVQFLNIDPATLQVNRPLAWLAMNTGLGGLAVGLLVGLMVGNLYRFGVQRWAHPSDALVRPLTLGSVGLLLESGTGVLWLMRTTLGVPLKVGVWLKAPGMLTAGWEQLFRFSALNGLLTWLGMLNPVTSLTKQSVLATQNLAAVLETGKWHIVHPLIASTILTPYANMGGTGMTLGLLVALFLVRHNPGQRQIGWLSALLVLSNFNAPLLVGLPVIWSPLLGIPFLLAPLAGITLSSLCLALRWVPATAYPLAVGTPGPLISFLGTGGAVSALILALINLALSTAIYYPFVKWAALVDQRGTKEAEQRD